MKSIWTVSALALCSMAFSAFAQDSGVFDQYREMLGDDSPAIFVIDEGEEYWYTPAGPNDVTLEACDLGLGAGVVEGAYAQMPRFFDDTGRVMDVEARLLHCMVTLQGRDAAEVKAKPYSGRGDMGTEIEALVAWIADQSMGLPLTPGQTHSEEQAAFALGEQIFYYRAGPHDFSCATCHEQGGVRIRLQDLAELPNPEAAREIATTWPAYRLSQGVVRTFGWRMRDCLRQQRLPELIMGSEASVALQHYLSVQASGAPMNAPGLKR